MILNICSNPDVLRVLYIIKTIITIIKIAVPILLIITGMLTYIDAVKNNDGDALNKANKLFVKKIIAAILIFFIPTFINIVTKVSNGSMQYLSCISDANQEGINNAYLDVARSYVNNSLSSLSEGSYNLAYNYIIRNIKNEDDKNKLVSELDIVKQYLDIIKEIKTLNSNFNNDSYNKIRSKIDNFPNEKIKKKLEEEYKRIIKTMPGYPNGKKESSATMSYVVHTPTLIKPNMPLVLYLHGDGGQSSNGSSPFLSASKEAFGNDLPYIIVTPAGGMWAETNGRLAELKSIIDTECEKYKCDKSKIIVTGHSRGSIGTWHMINNYPHFFYSAVPVSCGSYSINYSNFVGTKIRAYAGTSGSAEQSYNSAMQRNVNGIKGAGGDATFYSLKNAGHGDTPRMAYTKETLLWMIN